jgi:hypothetical protein
MKRLLIAAALFTAGLTAACSSPCDALADKCAKCNNAALKSNCETAVAAARAIPLTGNSSCQQLLDAKTYESCQ